MLISSDPSSSSQSAGSTVKSVRLWELMISNTSHLNWEWKKRKKRELNLLNVILLKKKKKIKSDCQVSGQVTRAHLAVAADDDLETILVNYDMIYILHEKKKQPRILHKNKKLLTRWIYESKKSLIDYLTIQDACAICPTPSREKPNLMRKTLNLYVIILLELTCPI